jgi:DNA-binding LacI/PurR family transcriptional regulator
MPETFTLKDLARMLKMSPSTISKALNDYPTISEMTRKRVRALAERLNYSPDPAAVSFKRKKSFSIGVIIPNLTDHFYAIAVGGIEEYAMRQGYKCMVCQHFEDLEREKDFCSMLERNKVDGLIVSISRSTTDIGHFKHLEERGIPVVYFVRRPGAEETFNVTSNVYQGSIDAVNYLASKGHRRIGHILGPPGLIATADRLNGYREGLQRCGLPWDESLTANSDLSETGTILALEQLTAMQDPPTAIITFKDYVALDAMLHLKKRNDPGVPAIEFIGFGNLPLLRYLDNPPLASLEEQCAAIGRRSAELLMSRILAGTKEILPEAVLFDCELKVLK